jgi:hypothetical protein
MSGTFYRLNWRGPYTCSNFDAKNALCSTFSLFHFNFLFVLFKKKKLLVEKNYVWEIKLYV